MPNFTFEEEGHIYKVGNRIIPSVTTVLGGWIKVNSRGPGWYVNEKTGVMVTGKMLDEAGDSGNAIHKGVKYILQGGVVWEALDSSLVAPLKEFGKFTRDHNLDISYVEEPMYSKKWDFAGTPDIIGTINDSKGVAIIDVKSGAPGELGPQSLFLNSPGGVGPQTAGYEILYKEKMKVNLPVRHPKIDRYCLELPKDGKPYKFYPLKDKDDLSYFHAKLFAYKYDQKRR